MSTHDDALCIHCNAALTARDLADGWCDSCGKRLPTAIRPKSEAGAGVGAAPAGGVRRWAFAIAGLSVVVLGVAAAFAVAG